MVVLGANELKAIFCKMVKQKKKQVEVCEYPPESELDQMLYAGLVGLLITVLAMVLHVLFYFLNSRVRHDFVKCFVSAAFLPLSVASVTKLISILQGLLTEDHTGWWQELTGNIHTVSVSAAYVATVFGCICLMFLSCFTHCTKRVQSMQESWVMFYTAEILGWLLSAAYHFTAFEFRRLPNVVLFVALSISILVILVAVISSVVSMLLCKNNSSRDNSPDPVISESRSRLAWSIASIVFCIPAFIAMYFYFCEMTAVLPSSYEYDQEEGEVLAVSLHYNYRILEFFSGPFMALAIFVLPTYRNALVGLLKRGKLDRSGMNTPLLPSAQVHPMTVQTVNVSAPPPPPPCLTYPPVPSNPVSSADDDVICIPANKDVGSAPFPFQPNGLSSSDSPQLMLGSAFVQIPPNYSTTIVYSSPLGDKPPAK